MPWVNDSLRLVSCWLRCPPPPPSPRGCPRSRRCAPAGPPGSSPSARVSRRGSPGRLLRLAAPLRRLHRHRAGDGRRAGRRARRERDTEGPLRIAVSLRSPSPLGPPNATAKAGIRTATALAEALGHRVVRADPPYPATLIDAWVRHWIAGVAADASELGLPMEEL